MSKIRNPLHIEVIPGILEKEWGEIEKKINLVLPFAESIHVDVLDGKFAPNITWLDPAPFAKYTKEVHFEAHLMVENPAAYIESFAQAGFQRFIGHIEKMTDVPGFIAKAQEWGEVGLAVDSPTHGELLYPYLEDIDVAFVMTVKAGFSRQTFNPEMLEKVGELRKKDALLSIEIDGGVSDANISVSRDAGATRFVSTGFIFDGNPEEQYMKLKERLL